MLIRVTYRDLSDEDIVELLKNPNIMNIEKLINIPESAVETVKMWLEEFDAHGVAISYAYNNFITSTGKNCRITLRQFSKIVKNVSEYEVKKGLMISSLFPCLNSIRSTSLPCLSISLFFVSYSPY